MVKTELIKRSPLRLLEKSTHGGVGKGNIGMIVSRPGIGKTACLVHIATDKLFNNKHVIHVSFSTRVDHIVSWYEDIFTEIKQKRSLDSAMEVHDEIIKNRVILNFNQDAISIDRVLGSVTGLIKEGLFEADAIFIDGFRFLDAKKDDLAKIKEFAQKAELEIWFSASLENDPVNYSDQGVPEELEDILDNIDVLITLETENDKLAHLKLVKEHGRIVQEDLHLKLESKTMLIAEE